MDKFFALKGGLDLVTPPIEASPGTATEALNYFEAVRGGYTRIAGYERLDGQLPPHLATYYTALITNWDLRATPTPLTVGNNVTFNTATFVILRLDESVDQTEMTVVLGEPDIDVPELTSPEVFDTNCLVTTLLHRGANDEVTDNIYLNAARDYRRNQITTVPGVGKVRGVAQIDGVALAWRDDGSGDLQGYRETSSGWELIPHCQVVEVTMISAGAVRGDKLQVLATGAVYTIVNIADAHFNYTPFASDSSRKYVTLVEDTSIGDVAPADVLRYHTPATAADFGTATSVRRHTFTGGGKVRSQIWNFYASSSSRYLYYTDGVNCAAVYMPEYNAIAPIGTKFDDLDDVWVNLIVHNNRMWYATAYGTAVTSVPDEPSTIDGFLGSNEWGNGDDITGFAESNTELLHTFTENTVQALKGTNIDEFYKYTVSNTSGAVADSIAQMDDTFTISSRGINSLKRTDALGGFDAATVSDDIQPLMRTLSVDDFTASTVIKSLNQIRFYYGDRILFMSRVPYNANGNEGIRYGLTEGLYPITVSCANTGNDTSGVERILIGSDDGYVYQTDVGTSFDGGNIISELSLQENHSGSPQTRKHYRSLDLEVKAGSNVDLELYYSLDTGRRTFNVRNITVDGGGDSYDTALYDLAVWDGFPLSRKKTGLVGTGRSIGFTFRHNDADTEAFTITGYSLRYTNRGLVV